MNTVPSDGNIENPPWISGAISVERRTRCSRITPYWRFLGVGKVPRDVPLEKCVELMKDLKEEGNDLYKDKEFLGAVDMYSAAIHIGGVLEVNAPHLLDTQLLSIIAANRAASFNKLDLFHESIENCDLALGLNPRNTKAFYRMACAFKNLRDYEVAFRVALDGQQVARSLLKNSEVKDFEDLLSEIVSQVIRHGDVKTSSNTAPPQVPTRCDAASKLVKQRLERRQKLEAVIPIIRHGGIQREFPPEFLGELLVELKAEGDAMLEEKGFRIAQELYTDAIRIAKCLEVERHTPVDKNLLSEVISNRAACLLKMDLINEAVSDCELAIQLNKTNVEAKYRMSMALKSMSDFKTALGVAEDGRNLAIRKDLKIEVERFDDLLCDIQSRISPPKQACANPTAKPANVKTQTKSKASDAKSSTKPPSKNSPTYKSSSASSGHLSEYLGLDFTASRESLISTESKRSGVKPKRKRARKKKKVPTATLR